MNILLVGSGGRESALAWKLVSSPSVNHVFVAPGNGGTATMSFNLTNVQVDATNFPELIDFSVKNHIALVVVGPEQPLVEGISEAFKAVGIPVFGPSKKAAQIEGSKAFSKDFMKRHQIPTALYQTFTDYNAAREFVTKHETGLLVLKASGLAAGKGVIVPQTREEALEGLKTIMFDHAFGAAGDEVVVEEFLEGEEVSLFAMTDGHQFVTFPAAQDHKRVFDGDKGPNTGGMGAYAPAPAMTPALLKIVEHDIVQKTIDGMRRDGMPYCGLLYVGLMITAAGPKVLEYNARFGDPETQVVIPLLADDCDLAQAFLACAEGRLDSVKVTFSKKCAATVVGAAEGYPGSYSKGKEISFSESTVSPSRIIFHAGTTSKAPASKQVFSSGGRVLCVTGVADTLEEAIKEAYAGIAGVSFEGMFYRKDIGYKASAAYRSSQAQRGVTYEDAGVSIDRGDQFVDNIKAMTASTKRVGTDSVIGGFGGLFDLKAAGFVDPILVSGTDGVGTKLRVAQIANYHSTVGIDLVAMSVNDVLVQGAEPLFFLDYYATSHLNLDIATQVVSGIAQGCRESGCGLIGGETAEMPGMYVGDDYDLAGFAVGAVERNQILPRAVSAGDVILGLPSSGVHSNGFSLVRHLISMHGFDYNASTPFQHTEAILGQALLSPTRLYVKACLPLIRAGVVEAMAHITGGGLTGNIPRVLPENCSCTLDASAWPLLPVFQWLGKLGKLSHDEMARTFNCGLGMILIIKPQNLARALTLLQEAGEQCYQIGTIIPGSRQVNIENRATAWNY